MSSRDACMFVLGAAAGAAAVLLIKKHNIVSGDDQPIILNGNSLGIRPVNRTFGRAQDDHHVHHLDPHGNPTTNRRGITAVVLQINGETTPNSWSAGDKLEIVIQSDLPDITLTWKRNGKLQVQGENIARHLEVDGSIHRCDYHPTTILIQGEPFSVDRKSFHIRLSYRGSTGS